MLTREVGRSRAMPASVVITCPQCKNQLKAPATIQGRKVRCRKCSTTFIAPEAPADRSDPKGRTSSSSAPRVAAMRPSAAGPAGSGVDATPYSFLEPTAEPAAKPPPPPAVPAALSTATPYGVSELKLDPRCPHCAKELPSEEAVVCLHCGYNNRTRTFVKTRVVYETTAGDRFRWRLPGFACVAVIIGLVLFDVWYVWGLDEMWKSMDETWPASFSGGLKLYGVVMSLAGMFFAGKFAIRRLIFERNPPEVEKKK